LLALTPVIATPGDAEDEAAGGVLAFMSRSSNGFTLQIALG
jgi:hypothetical protein